MEIERNRIKVKATGKVLFTITRIYNENNFEWDYFIEEPDGFVTVEHFMIVYYLEQMATEASSVYETEHNFLYII